MRSSPILIGQDLYGNYQRLIKGAANNEMANEGRQLNAERSRSADHIYENNVLH